MAEIPDVKRKPVRKEDGSTPSVQSGQFSHPVYKRLAVFNGEVNRMTRREIQDKLKVLHLDTRGVKEVLKKRLKNYHKKQNLSETDVKPATDQDSYDYYLVIDFEATCEENNYNYSHEIIEFPIILVDSTTRKVVDEFHAYVRPTENPRLTEFCKGLTGITQAQVDAAATFPVVLEQAQEWINKHNLGTGSSFAVLTDGPWDMGRFMYQQCRLLSLKFPRWARKWCNLRKAYSNFYRFRKPKLLDMLNSLGMEFEGNQHSGIDDSRNIARILMRMLQDGAQMRVNEKIHSRKLQRCASAITYEAGEDDDICDDALVDTVTLNSGSEWDDDDEDVLAVDLARLRVDCKARVSESENPNDLLAYYELQKSK